MIAIKTPLRLSMREVKSHTHRISSYRFSTSSKEIKDIIKLGSDEGIIGACVTSGELINISDAYQDDRFNSKHDKQASFHTKSVLAMPIKNEDKVIGGIQMINKKQKDDGKVIDFTKDDERLATMMAAHVTSFISIIG